MSSELKNRLPVLTGTENYMQWRTMMTAYLQMTGVWPHVEATIASPAAAAQGANATAVAAADALIEAWRDKHDRAKGIILLYCASLVQQGLINIDDPHLRWEHLRMQYGSPGAAGIFVEYNKVNTMRFSTHEDPSHKIDEMRTIYSYLSANGLTLPDSAQAMSLLAALPKEWGSFAMTLLATLPMNVNQAGVAAGIPQLTFSNVVPKIQEEWSRRSGRSVMPKDDKRIVKKEHNTVAKESTPRCRKCKGRHATSDHRDDYKRPNIPQIAPHTYPNRPPQQNKAPKKKGGKKGKGGPRQNEASTSQNLLDGDAGWSVLTPLHLATDSQTHSVRRDLAKCEREDAEYACRLQSRTLTYLDRRHLDDGYMYDMAENDVDFSCYSSALMQGYSCDSCHRQPNSGTKFKRLCPSHAHLAGLWLLDSGASDHSTPYLEDFLTYKKLAKPVRVQTAGKEIIWFPGIGTVAFTTTVQG